ncbi:MAG: hypothetical protein KAH38_04200 [Candidatus Hydrogenedentes bacterium]|nr:hypothetical protein [Candidatus Hydrogenedentota bacterium]
MNNILYIIAALLLAAAPVAFAQTYDLSLDNGVIHIGVETDEYGGAISYLSLSGETRNLINNHDRGRQIQQSYYAGQGLDRTAEGQHPSWSPWTWNPIQVGDAYENSSQVMEANKQGNEIYVKTQPLLWDMNNELAECYFETWITLDKSTAHVHNKITIFRTDDLWTTVANRHQEMPALYSIADLHRIFAYEGNDPFTKAALREITGSQPPSWEHWGQSLPTEKWAALVDNTLWGIGVYNGDADLFAGGLNGMPGGGEFDAFAGYITPIGIEALDKDTILEYEYDIIVDELDNIRAFVYNAEGFPDYDGDGLSYEQETDDLNLFLPGIQNPFNPSEDDSTGDNGNATPDSIPDGQNDWDGDGMSNADEFQQGFDPVYPGNFAPWTDSDGDGISNLHELEDLDSITPGIQNPFNMDIADSTSDNGNPNPDGIPDGRNDWDGDGMTNADEFDWGFDPTNPMDFGNVPVASPIAQAILAALIIGLSCLVIIRLGTTDRHAE